MVSIKNTFVKYQAKAELKTGRKYLISEEIVKKVMESITINHIKGWIEVNFGDTFFPNEDVVLMLKIVPERSIA